MVIVKYVCESCDRHYKEERFERDYMSGGVFWDGAFYGDDGVTRMCPRCGKALKEEGRVMPWEVKR